MLLYIEVSGAKPVRTDRMERSAVDPDGDGPFCDVRDWE